MNRISVVVLVKLILVVVPSGGFFFTVFFTDKKDMKPMNGAEHIRDRL
jgi:hypothetical protein